MMTAREKAAFFMGAMSMLEGFGRGDVDIALAIVRAAAKRMGCSEELLKMEPEFRALVRELGAIALVNKT
jgi:hypothetical protein